MIETASTQFFRPDDQTIAYDRYGSGPPVLLLHGFPQTRAMWQQIAPGLARDFTIVAPDLRGYGDSFKPPAMEDMSFRNMAGDMVALMADLGFERFHAVGHDRGGRTAHRLALDHPKAVQSLTLMDIVPTHFLLANITTPVARAYYHWYFLVQPEPLPERMINSDPDAFFEHGLRGFGHAALDDFDPDMLAAYRRAWHDPDCVRTMCNDYRAAIDVDEAHDIADLARKVTCPALVLYGRDGVMARLMDVPGSWSDRLADMQEDAMPGGHFFPDQFPDATLTALRRFLL